MNLGVKMRRALLLSTILCWLFPNVWCSAAERVAASVVFSSDIEPYQHAWSGFEEFFSEKKVPLWVSEYNLKEEEPAKICSQINKERPDIVVTLGTKASKLAKENITEIPVVFCMILNPQKMVGSNITGVSMEIPTKIKIKGIKEILPDAKNIGLIYSPGSKADYQEISWVYGQRGFKLVTRKVGSEEELAGALKEISGEIDCFLMIPDSKIYSPISVKHLLIQSLREEFPVIGLSSLYTKAGALFSFDCHYQDLGRQAAGITLRILNGEKPGDIAPLMPKKAKLSLNLATAERLRLRIPSQIVEEAEEVFGK
jgi:putative ABC transport system substrate-binding protein